MVFVQLLASFTVMMYVPAGTLLNVPFGLCVQLFGLMVKVFVPVPPLAVTMILPVLLPPHKTLVTEGVPKVRAVGCVIVIVVVLLQLLASVTVNV